MSNFWNNLPRPIFCLAPMEEVTDVVFREMFAKYGKSDGSDKSENRKNNFVMFTEFINVDGILHPTGFERLKIDLEYTENQRPIVAQIWGTDPEKFYEAAKLMVKMGFDGVDINMGCPQDKEIGIGACAALIRNPKLASEIIAATIKGCSAGPRPASVKKAGQGPALQEYSQTIPVSVKTRLGYSKADEMEAWVEHLLKHNIAALTIHARTKQEKSKVPAQWNKIKEAVEVRNRQQGTQNINHGTQTTEYRTLIIGNGDVKSREEGLQRIAETGCDGVMIARGAFGNPWMFRPDNYKPTVKERLAAMLEHAKIFNDKLGAHKSFFIMRKSFKAYCSGFDGAHELRAKLMETKNFSEAEKITKEFLKALD